MNEKMKSYTIILESIMIHWLNRNPNGGKEVDKWNLITWTRLIIRGKRIFVFFNHTRDPKYGKKNKPTITL